MRFDWDPEKNRANLRKHGISFEEAQELFTSGVDYLEVYDDAHSVVEDRFIAIGPIQRGVVLVAYAVRYDDIIRIVSARMATRNEKRNFDRYWRERE